MSETSGQKKRGVLGVICGKKFVKNADGYATNGAFMKYIESMTRYFDKIELCVPVTRRNKIDAAVHIDSKKFHVIELPFYVSFLSLTIMYPVIWWRIRQNMGRWDVVNPRYPDLVGVFAALQASELGVPSFHTVVGDWEVEAKLGSSKGPLLRPFINPIRRIFFMFYLAMEKKAVKNNLLFCHGQSITGRLSRYTDRANAIFATSIDDENIVFPEKPAPRETARVLAVGRLSNEKGHNVLLEALARLKDESELKWEARIVGWGHLKESLQKKAKDLGLGDSVEFTGGVPFGPEIVAQYDWADVFVHPSRSEGTPKVIFEAMARGIPVIATRVGGVPQMIEDGKTGVLISSDNVAEMAGALKKVTENADLYEGLRKNANKFVRGRTRSAYAEKIIEEFDKQCGGA